ncbi:MAG: hypothetical protein INH43_21475 [Acidobacteriaceae bacterium]|jgi:hypothetical protein|nr:hypothetical protein [Acidobacteriaceae bacterium]
MRIVAALLFAAHLRAAHLLANDACQQHYQAQLPAGRTFRIPPRQKLLTESRPGDPRAAQVVWGFGFVSQNGGATEQREFVCLLDARGKATAVYLKPLPPAAPRLARR